VSCGCRIENQEIEVIAARDDEVAHPVEHRDLFDARHRRRQLNLAALYQPNGEYRYTNGFSWVAIAALVLGTLPSLPGFLANVRLLDQALVPSWLLGLYNYAWFVGFGVAFVVYLAGRKAMSHDEAQNRSR